MASLADSLKVVSALTVFASAQALPFLLIASAPALVKEASKAVWKKINDDPERYRASLAKMEADLDTYKAIIKEHKNNNSVESFLIVNNAKNYVAALSDNNRKPLIAAINEYIDNQHLTTLANKDVNAHIIANTEPMRLKGAERRKDLLTNTLGYVAGSSALMTASHHMHPDGLFLSGFAIAVSTIGMGVRSLWKNDKYKSTDRTFYNEILSNYIGEDSLKEWQGRDIFSYRKRDSWVVHYPGVEQAMVLNTKQYNKFKSRVNQTDTPFVELNIGQDGDFRTKRTVGGQLQADEGVPSVAFFSVDENGEAYTKDTRWHNKGKWLEEEFFKTNYLLSTPSIQIKQRESDGLITAEGLTLNDNGKVNRFAKDLSPEDAYLLLPILNSDHSDDNKQILVFKRLGLNSPESWITKENERGDKYKVQFENSVAMIEKDDNNKWSINLRSTDDDHVISSHVNNKASNVQGILYALSKDQTIKRNSELNDNYDNRHINKM